MGELAVILVAGIAAGVINAVVGSGTLITYPLLLSIGLAPVAANATNNVGLSVGGISAAWTSRAELRPRLRSLMVPVAMTLGGAVIGALLVVRLPARVFTAVVPWLILLAVVAIALQPFIARWVQHRATHPHHVARDLPAWTALLGAYGGYFGAGQGVMYLAVLGLRYSDDVRLNIGVKNLLAASANTISALVFIIAGVVTWPFAIALGVGSTIGGYVGGHWMRRMHPLILRVLVIAVGVYVAGYLFIAY